MTGYSLKPPVPEDAAALAPLVREEECRELWCLHRLTPIDALTLALRQGGECGGLLYALHGPDGVLGLGGARPVDVLGTAAIPWFIGVDMRPHRRFLARYSRRFVAHALGRYPVLVNVVGAWNRQSLAWLNHAGFTIGDRSVPLGPDGAHFFRFWAYREV